MYRTSARRVGICWLINQNNAQGQMKREPHRMLIFILAILQARGRHQMTSDDWDHSSDVSGVLESVGTSIDLAAISVVIFFLRSVRPVRVFMLDMLERPMRFWEYDRCQQQGDQTRLPGSSFEPWWSRWTQWLQLDFIVWSLDVLGWYGNVWNDFWGRIGRVHLMSESRKKKHLPLELGQMLTWTGEYLDESLKKSKQNRPIPSNSMGLNYFKKNETKQDHHTNQHPRLYILYIMIWYIYSINRYLERWQLIPGYIQKGRAKVPHVCLLLEDLSKGYPLCGPGFRLLSRLSL